MTKCIKCNGKGTIFNVPEPNQTCVLAWFAMTCYNCNGTGEINV